MTKNKRTFFLSIIILLFFSLAFLISTERKKEINMAEPTWGALEKSQVNNETIEQAIARLITAHLADADAHANAGESLAVHKAQDVIDHPEGSLLADKKTWKEFELIDNSLLLGTWVEVDGNLSNSGYALILEKPFNDGTKAIGTAEVPFLEPLEFGTKEMVLQVLITRTLGDVGAFTTFTVGTGYESPGDGFGFKIENDGITLYIDMGGNRYFSSKYSAVLENYHLYRVHLVPNDGKAYLYIDGTQRASVDIPEDEPLGDDMNLELYISALLTDDPTSRLSELYLSQEI